MPIDSSALVEALVNAGTISTADRDRAAEALRERETLLNALLRVSPLRFADLVTLHFGPNGLPSHGERSLNDRLGARLIAAKALTQFQLKQALMAQVHQPQPLGRLLQEGHGVSASAIQAALGSQEVLKPRLSDADQLGPLLIRWGILSPEQWRAVLAAGRNPAQTLLAQHLCNKEHLQRAHLYLQEKRALFLRRRHRLGEVLVATRVLDRETLAKALACQVDQPFMLGELLVMQRYCSPEAVLEGLAEQQRRYDADAEALLPPLTPVLPPELPAPEPEPEEAPRPDRRRAIALALAVTVIIGSATWYGMRFQKGDFGWLGMFARPGQAGKSPGRSAPGDVLSGSASAPQDQGPASRYDDLSIPGAEATLQGSSASLLADLGLRDDPFAKDGAPSTPNTMPPMSELPSQGVRGEGVFAAPEGAGPPRATQANPMSGPAGAPSSRYPMSHDPVPAPQPAGQGVSAPSPFSSSQPSLNARLTLDPMRGREGDAAFTPPANVPPPPVEPSRRKLTTAPSDLDERTINRSGAVFHYRLGQANFAQGRTAAARQEFLAALATDPDNPLPLYYLGRLEEAAGRGAEARKAYERYLARLPNGEFRAEVAIRIQRLKN
ncbi:MAG TPA: tetratricopeptide repeat protein [Pantanalinema sp.]